MRVAVTGATGFVGSAVVRRLLAEGHQIRALVRPGPRARESLDVGSEHARVKIIDGDLVDRRTATRLVADSNALVHLALEHQHGRYRGGEGTDPIGFVLANLSASLHLVRTAMEARVPRVVFASSRAVYDGWDVRLPDVIADDAPPAPTTLYGACKAGVESMITTSRLPIGVGGGRSVCGIRPTGIYGITKPAESSKWWEIVHAVAHHHAVDTDGGGTEVHVDDVAEGIHLLLTARPADVSGRIFNCSDLYVSRRAIAGLAKEALDRGVTCGRSESTEWQEQAAAGEANRNVLDSTALTGLGVSFRGWTGVRSVVDDLCTAVRRTVHRSS